MNIGIHKRNRQIGVEKLKFQVKTNIYKSLIKKIMSSFLELYCSTLA